MVVSGRKLKLDRCYVPTQIDEDDEMFANGIFVFNITKLLSYVGANPDNFPIEEVDPGSFPAKTCSTLDELTIQTANLANPILLAEIRPGRYNVIDGNHRLARAQREGRDRILAYRITMEQHLPFLTSMEAYRAFVSYWNSKLDEA